MIWTENNLGLEHKTNHYLVFFGKKDTTLQNLKDHYPQFIFREVKQTHSDICVSTNKSKDTVETADAHYTDDSQVALIIKTADCLPIMMYDKTKRQILSIHAGWRGIENQITKKTILVTKANNLEVFVGPHILQSSFEVDVDAKDLLHSRYLSYLKNQDPKNDIDSSKKTESVFEKHNNKYHIDLSQILIAELNSIEVNYQINFIKIDTVTSFAFNSYRRDKSNAGRNLSFIAKLD